MSGNLTALEECLASFAPADLVDNATNATNATIYQCFPDEAAQGLQPRHLIGLVLALASIVLTNIALLIQKYSAHKEAGRPCYRRPRFWLGFTLNTASEGALSLPATLFAPLALIAPLGGVAVACNAIFTRFGLICGIQETMSQTEWVATGIIIVGVVLVALSGPGGDTTMQSCCVAHSLGQPAFIAFLCLSLSLIVFTLIIFPPFDSLASPRLNCIRPKPGSAMRTALSGFTSSACGGFSVLAIKYLAHFLFGLPAEAKGLSPAPALLAATLTTLVTAAPLQLYLLNLSLASGKATFAIPLYQTLLMFIISFLGGVLFQEFDSLLRTPMPLYIIMYAVGFIMSLGGLIILSNKQQARAALAKTMAAVGPAAPSPDAVGQMDFASPSGDVNEGREPDAAEKVQIAAEVGSEISTALPLLPGLGSLKGSGMTLSLPGRRSAGSSARTSPRNLETQHSAASSPSLRVDVNDSPRQKVTSKSETAESLTASMATTMDTCDGTELGSVVAEEPGPEA